MDSVLAEAEWRGDVALEVRRFTSVEQSQNSLSFNPQWYWQAERSNQLVELELFGRYDDLDADRSHVDLRQLTWSRQFESFEFSVGVGRVFWGVTESLHLVDLINQTDFVESVDGEDKLGQPMVHLSRVNDWGTLDLFVLPYFRLRTFNSPNGLLSGPVEIADNAQFESSAGQQHTDVAMRFSQIYGNWDIGLSAFSGTNRDPKFLMASRQTTILTPYYDQAWQISLDAQATIGAWLWKLEWLTKEDSVGDYWASVAGFEYTFFGVVSSAADVGLLLEYQSDSRGQDLIGFGYKDAFSGMRVTLNDIQDSQFLAGVVRDLDNGESLVFVEASRRFGGSWRMALDARLFSGFEPASANRYLNNLDHLTLTVEYHF